MANYNFDNKEVDDIVASYTAYKGKYTTASRKLELLVDLQSKNYSAVTATNINEHLAKTERVVDILAALAEWLKVNRHPKRDEYISLKLLPGRNKCESLQNLLSSFTMRTLWATVVLVKPGGSECGSCRSRCSDKTGPGTQTSQTEQ